MKERKANIIVTDSEAQLKDFSILGLINRRDFFDLVPPYQRANIWVVSWKQSLIATILEGVPIAPVSFVQTSTRGQPDAFLVLDGKQRLCSIYDFVDDKFTINLDLFQDGKHKAVPTKYSTLKKIAESKDSKDTRIVWAQHYYEKFTSYSVRGVVYPKMTWADQIDLFEKINHSKALTPDELFIKDYMFARQFVEFVTKNYMPSLPNFARRFVTKTSNADDRGRNLMFRYYLIMSLMGGNLNSPYIDLDKLPTDKTEEFKAFLKSLDEKVKSYLSDQNDEYLFNNSGDVSDRKDRVSSMCSKFGWDRLLDCFKNYNTSSNLIIDVAPKHYTFTYLYFALTLTKMFNDNILTEWFVKKHKEKLKETYDKYHTWTQETAKEENATVRRAGTIEGRKIHLAKISELLVASGLDFGKKNQKFTKEEKEAALKKAKYRCEECGSTENLQVDHVLPGALTSSKIPGVLCEVCNLNKSANSKEDCLKHIDYIDNHTLP